MLKVHLVRHAEGYHNVEGPVELSGRNLLRLFQGGWRRLTAQLIWRVFQQLLWQICLLFSSSKPRCKPRVLEEHADASLTARGWQQVDELRRRVKQSGLCHGVELVVVSPLTRTLETAAGVFGGDPAIWSSETPSFVAVELCREHFGVHLSGRRSSITSYKIQFPVVDFSQIENDEDTLWKPDSFESEQDGSARCKAFLQWLLNREENEIAVVSHCGFLARLFQQLGDPSLDCSQFQNCELRTVVLDRAKLAKRLQRESSKRD